jgi:hypothetical protein
MQHHFLIAPQKYSNLPLVGHMPHVEKHWLKCKAELDVALYIFCVSSEATIPVMGQQLCLFAAQPHCGTSTMKD